MNTYPIYFCLCSIHSERLTHMNVESCFCKCFLFCFNLPSMYCIINLIEKKAFDRVWHKNLMYKLKNSGINGNLFINRNWISFSCKFVKACVPQGSVLGPLFSFIYINDFPQGLISDVKVFADDTSLLSIVNCSKASGSVLNSDLLKIQDWAYQWKMSFNPDRAKQAKEVIFSRKTIKFVHPIHLFTLTIKFLNSHIHTEAPGSSAR